MIEDELTKIWQSSPKVEQVKFEKSRLLLDMQSSLNRFYQFAKYNILIGQIALMMMIPVFLFYIYFVPPILAKIASLLIAICGIWHSIMLRKLKKDKPRETAANYLEYLKSNSHYVGTIIKTTKFAAYGYTLISMPGYFLFITGFYLDGIVGKGLFIKMILIGVVGHLICFIISYYVVKKIYVQRLKKLNELIRTLEE